MDSAVECIRAKITGLEAKLADLRIAARELLALETLAPNIKTAPAPKPKRRPKAPGSLPARQSIGADIADVLSQHGAFPVAEIAGHIEAGDRALNKRSVYYAQRDMKKQGRAKTSGGKWMLAKAGSGQVPPDGRTGEFEQSRGIAALTSL